jgi:type I restriction enzyme S subunit
MSNYPIMWKEEKLSNLSTLITKGATPTTYGHDYVHSLTEGGARFVRGNNATISGKFKGSDVKYICHTANEQLKRSKLKVGDIVISIVGSVGTSFQVDKRIIPANINQNVALIRPSNELNSDYLGQVIVSEIVQDIIATELTVQAQPSLSLKQIGDFTIPFPPFPEQQKIAQILTSVDDVIEKTQAQIDKLKDLKIAMMQELLTNGIGHLEFKDSAVGRIPVGWEVNAIGSLAKLTSGGTPSREMPDYWGGNIAWVKTGEIKYATIYKTEEYITEKGLKESSAKVIPSGSVLMAMYGQGITRGRVAILGIAASMNQACLAMIPNECVNNVFLYYFLTNEYGNLRSLVQEGAQKNLNAAIVKDFMMPVPPLSEQQEIVRILSSIDTKLEVTNKKSNSLKNTKKALMQDLLTGKVRVNTELSTSSLAAG